MTKNKIFYTILRPFVIVFLYLKFGYTFKVAKKLPPKYIVLSNHSTDYDPLFVAASFRRMMYFVASEHIARWKVAYKFIKFLLDPITRCKGAPAYTAVMEIMRRMRKGSNVCMFAEGVRTWDGVTTDIEPSTAKLIKSSGCALVTYKIIGGYFTSPMWSGASVRRGKVSGSVVNVYTKEQLQNMSADEVYRAITNDLYEDAYERQMSSPTKYKGKNLAEKLEKLTFICPECGARETLRSNKNTVVCDNCSHSFCYNEYGMLEGGKFSTVKDFYNWQLSVVERDVAEKVSYSAPKGLLSAVSNHNEEFITQGPILFSEDGLKCGEMIFPINEISDLAMHGQSALVFTFGKKYYEIIVEKNVNALKFLLYFKSLKRYIKEESVV